MAEDETFPYALTEHARAVLAERGVELAWVARVISQPTRIEPDRGDPALRHALGMIPEGGDRVLRVVYNESVQPWRIVTAYFDRRERRKR